VRFVNKNTVELIGTRLVGEASAMGLAPGEWPEFIALVNSDTATEGYLFHKSLLVDGDGTRHYYAASDAAKQELVVIND
jgi:hypothetical protein